MAGSNFRHAQYDAEGVGIDDPQSKYNAVQLDELGNLVDSTGKNVTGIGGTTIRTRGMFKPPGAQATVPEAQGGNTPRILKLEAEAPFSRVRLWMFNRNVVGADQIKFAVGTTDNLDNSTINNTFVPQRNGVASNVAASATVPHGWKIGTWGGNQLSPRMYASGGEPFSGYRPGQSTLSIPDIIVSDWVDVRSVDPLTVPPNGIKRPLLLLALGRVTAGGIPGVLDGYNTWLTASAQNTNYTNWLAGTDPWVRLRLGGVCNTTPQDAIGTGVIALPTAWTAPPAVAADAIPLYFALEYDYDVPCRSFLAIGDSNTEGYAWLDHAINAVSTPEKPYVLANMGQSTCRWVEFEQTAMQMLYRGMAPTDIVMPSHSHNDTATAVGNSLTDPINNRGQAAAEYSRQRQRILALLDVCDRLGAQAWIWTHFNGYHRTNLGPPEPETVLHLQWVRDLCATGRAKLIDITNDAFVAANGAGANLLEDDIHFTIPAGRDYARAVAITSLKKD